MSLADAAQVGWGIVFHEDTPQDVRDALAPLVDHRRSAGGKPAESARVQEG